MNEPNKTEEMVSPQQTSTDKPDSVSNGVTLDETGQAEGLSKRKLKKIRKTQKWEENKLRKRAEERARKKERRKLAREQGLDLGPSRKSLKRVTMAGSSCHQRVVIDCSFDDLMSDKDIANIVRQLNHCYAVNRRTANPVQFYVTGVEKQMKARLEMLKEYKSWDVHFHGESYLDLFSPSDVVYLSSDSDNVIQSLDEQKVYVIGGLIDHNHHKGLCLKLANEKGLNHARLPITDYVHFNTRKVLTVNQVFEILVGYTEKQDWEYAFLKAIPKRKEATAKRKAKDMSSSLDSPSIDQEDTSSQKNADSSDSEDLSDKMGSEIISDGSHRGACSNSTDISCLEAKTGPDSHVDVSSTVTKEKDSIHEEAEVLSGETVVSSTT